MSKTAHTTGPWQVVPTPFNEGFTVLAQPHSALRGFTKVIAFVGDKAEAENEANARLIAAAPEMLEALKQAAGMSAFDRLPEVVSTAAYHAISKAEGRTNA